MSHSQSIVNLLVQNRMSTTEVADALGKRGVLLGMRPVNQGHHRVGVVRCIFAAHNSNFQVHEEAQFIQPNEIALIVTHEFDIGTAVIGDLIAKYVLLYRSAAAIVVHGAVRDVAALRREGFAVWSEDYSPLGCSNASVNSFPHERMQEIREIYDGGIAVCDDGGVTVIPKALVSEATLSKLESIELQEDIWFYCLDTLKWDTRKIVCDKAYLTEPNVLSAQHVLALAKLLDSGDQDSSE